MMIVFELYILCLLVNVQIDVLQLIEKKFAAKVEESSEDESSENKV